MIHAVYFAFAVLLQMWIVYSPAHAVALLFAFLVLTGTWLAADRWLLRS